jgi:putative DNA primase/helicase
MTTEFDGVLAKLDHAKKIGEEFTARCPAHDDQRNSLSIKCGLNGKALLYCHAGCDYLDIAKALNLPRNGHNGIPIEPKIVAIYDYVGLKGQLLYQVVRYEPKAFKQRRPHPECSGAVIWDLKGITPTLYHLQDVVRAIENRRWWYVVRGKKTLRVFLPTRS